MPNYIYVIHSGSNEENEASSTELYKDISEVFAKLESLISSENLRLKTQGVNKKPLRSTAALDKCLDDDTVYLELLDKTKTLFWYNINKFNLEVYFG